jgi:hypothetical protein
LKAEKYPRTPHLPWSEGATSDDVFLNDCKQFEGKEVVVTEKLDGECTTMYHERIHARSTDSRDHPSRHMVKALWAKIKNDIPDTIRITGENCFAKHSIFYNSLPSVFMVFSIFDDWYFEWDDVTELCKILDLKTVPVLYRGTWDIDKIKTCYTGKSLFGDTQEGYVIRLADRFDINNFSTSVAKFVRKNHVQTNEHWMSQKIIPNVIL